MAFFPFHSKTITFHAHYYMNTKLHLCDFENSRRFYQMLDLSSADFKQWSKLNYLKKGWIHFITSNFPQTTQPNSAALTLHVHWHKDVIRINISLLGNIPSALDFCSIDRRLSFCNFYAREQEAWSQVEKGGKIDEERWK